MQNPVAERIPQESALTTNTLAPSHFKFLRASALNDESIATMACYSLSPAQSSRLSPALAQCESVLAFPYPGFENFARYRLFPPLDKMKYWQPSGSPLHLYILPAVRSVLTNPNIEIAITEGEKKAACLTQHGIPTIGIGGVWNWLVKDTCELLPEFHQVAFVDRSILIIFDSDTWVREEIQRGLYALGKAVENRGGKVEALVIPPAANGDKQGADDYILANGIGKFKELKRIKLRHDGLSQHKPWWEKWHEKKSKETKEIGKLAAQLVDVKPWPDPVDGALLLDEIQSIISRFIVMAPEAIIAETLWIVFAHCLDAFSVAPLLTIVSPTPECGKSINQSVVGKLVPKALISTNITQASLFRVVEKYKPVLIIDEVDTAFASNDDLRTLINASHLRSQAFVIRSADRTQAHEPQLFSSWGAKCLALINRTRKALPDTIAGRSVLIHLQRKRRQDKTDRFYPHRQYPDLDIVCRKAARWADDNMTALSQAMVDDLPGLGDRQFNNWESLLAIADIAGGGWPKLAREAAVKLCGEPQEESTAIELLRDIKLIFDGNPESDSDNGCEAIFSAELVKSLNAKEDRPWPDYGRNGITQNQVGRLLKEFRIYSRTIRIDDQTFKGYKAEWFQSTFERYLAHD
jgi:hypothetical protein